MTGDDVTRATKRITNATVVSKATTVSKIIAATVRSKDIDVTMLSNLTVVTK
jgi:hypothetical protein